MKVGTVAKGTETHRLARETTVGCGGRSPLAESVLEDCWLQQAILQVDVLATRYHYLSALVTNIAGVIVEV